jgi:hypothetical protein
MFQVDGSDIREDAGPLIFLPVIAASAGSPKGIGPALIARAQQMGVQLPAELSDPGADVPPRLIVSVLRQIAGHFFPLLAEGTKDIR